MDREIELWGFEGDENLVYTGDDDAIEGFLDGLGEDYLPATIELQGYARMVPTVSEFRSSCVEHLMERLDEEYGDPNGECDKISNKMFTLEKIFIQGILDLYQVWSCECVHKETIDVETWVKNNAPGWLTDGSIKGFKQGGNNEKK